MMIVDTHSHAGINWFEPVEMILHQMNLNGVEKTVLSTHCHDDLGMAVANSLAGVKNGARQIECAINGLGERAGNAALEEVIMAIHTRADFFDAESDHRDLLQVNTKEIYRTSQLVSRLTGFVIPPNKAIVKLGRVSQYRR